MLCESLSKSSSGVWCRGSRLVGRVSVEGERQWTYDRRCYETPHTGVCVCVSSREIINDVFTLINLWCSVTLRHSHFLCPIWRPSHSIVNVVCWITIRTTEPLNCCFCCIFLGRQSFSAVNYWHTNVFRHGKLFPPVFFFRCYDKKNVEHDRKKQQTNHKTKSLDLNEWLSQRVIELWRADK